MATLLLKSVPHPRVARGTNTGGAWGALTDGGRRDVPLPRMRRAFHAASVGKLLLGCVFGA